MKADPIDSPLGRRMTAAHQIAIDALRERPRSSLELDRLMAAEVGPDATAVDRPAWREPSTRVVVRAAWRHFAAFVPLVHVPHAEERYGRSRYALAADWLGEERPEIEESTARIHLARRYLAAFGPASVEDLVAYVGRGKGGIGIWRDAVAAIGDDLLTMTDERGRSLLTSTTARVRPPTHRRRPASCALGQPPPVACPEAARSGHRRRCQAGRLQQECRRPSHPARRWHGRRDVGAVASGRFSGDRAAAIRPAREAGSRGARGRGRAAPRTPRAGRREPTRDLRFLTRRGIRRPRP